MEASDLDRLEQSVKRAFERIEHLESERKQLSADKRNLEAQIREQASGTNRLPQESPPTIATERLSDLKERLAGLIERIGEFERQL